MSSASSSSSTKGLYRSLLREVRLAAQKPRKERNISTEKQLRTIIGSSPTATTTTRTANTREGANGLETVLVEARDYLRSSRIHAELLKRYNPTLGMTDAEKVHAAARRVGLDTPLTYKVDK